MAEEHFQGLKTFHTIISTAALLLAVIPFFLSCRVEKLREMEPNDSFSTAHVIELNKSILGYIDPAEDRDFYRLDILEDSVLDLSLSGVKGVNLAIKIWKGEENPIVVKLIDDGRKSSPERFANLFASPDVYFITVLHGEKDLKKANDEMPYELLIRGRASGKEEHEPNDSPDTANPIIPGEEIKGYFSPACNSFNKSESHPLREEDWYTLKIDLDSNPKLLDVTLSGVNSVNSVLALYGQDMELLKTADTGGYGQPEEIRGVGILKSGTFYILIASKGYGANHEETYYLNANLRDCDPSHTMEPNDSFTKANPVLDGKISGSLETGDEKDILFFEPKAENIFRIELVPASDLDCVMIIHDSNQRKLFESGILGRGRRVIFPDFYSTDKFYISVYTKSAPARILGYDLFIRPLERPESMEIEPNDVPFQASPVKNGHIAGFTTKPQDKDYFLMEYHGRVKKEFVIRAPKYGEIKVSVTDPMGFIIKTVKIKKNGEAAIREMVDRKGYIFVESVAEDYDNPYNIYIRDKK